MVVSLGLLPIAAAGATRPAGARGPLVGAGQPNVVILNADDWREPPGAGLASYMPKTARWIAGAGTAFPKSEVPNPNCCPSRAGLFSGRYDHNNGVRTQADGLKLDEATTVEFYLHRAGYQTALVGKFLNSWPQTRPPPNWDYFAMWEASSYLPPFTVNLNGRRSTGQKYATTYAGDRMMDALRSFAPHPSRPWLLYGALHAPHITRPTNLAIPEPKYANAPVPPCLQPGEADVSDQPAYVGHVHLDRAFIAKVCASQLRAMMSVDDQYDRVFRYLQSSGQLGRTLIFVTSDNGYLWGEHNRLSKFVPFLPSVRVPLYARWDGHFGHTVSQRMVSNVDLTPTILAAAGVRPNPAVPLDGRPLLGGRGRSLQLNEFWFDRADAKIPTWAQIHTNSWAYDEYYKPDGTIDSRAYYNLAADPAENLNLLGDADPRNDPPNLSQLHRRLVATKACKATACP